LKLSMHSIDELVSNLNEICQDLDINRMDLTSPKEEKICAIYVNLLAEFGIEINLQNLRGFDSKISDELPEICKIHPELFQNIEGKLYLISAMRFLFKKIGYERDFGLSDLTRPDSKRTHSNLSFIVNFWSFCNDHYPTVKQISESVRAKHAGKAKLEKEVRTLENKLESAKVEGKAKAERIRALEAEIEDFQENEKQILVEEIDKINTERETLASETAILEKETEELERQAVDLKEQTTSLNSLLNCDEDKNALLEQIRRVGEGVTDLKAKNTHHRLRFQALDGHIKSMATLTQNFSELTKKIPSESESEEGRQIEKELAEMHEAYGKLEIELRELENSIETQKNKENMHVKKSTNKKKAKEEEKSALDAQYRKESKKFGDERLGYSALKAEISKGKANVLEAEKAIVNQEDILQKEEDEFVRVAQKVADKINWDTIHLQEMWDHLKKNC